MPYEKKWHKKVMYEVWEVKRMDLVYIKESLTVAMALLNFAPVCV